MHYYKKNIGDYHKKAGRLSMLEHGAYTLLMDSCYDREKFPTKEQAIDWCWARTDEEIAAVVFVLGKFFILEGDRYYQGRIQEEVDKYQENSSTNKRIAQERESKRREKRQSESTKRERGVNESPPNQEPRTIKQEPITASSINKFTERDLAGSIAMFEKILLVAQKTRKPNFDKWADHFRLMREQDDLTHEEIWKVFMFANSDPFWSTNILSPKTLRSKFASLHAKMNGAMNGQSIGNTKSKTDLADDAVRNALDRISTQGE